jgi:hypothetical protein
MKSDKKLKIYQKSKDIVTKRIKESLETNNINTSKFLKVIQKNYINAKSHNYKINTEKIETTNSIPSIERTIINLLENKNTINHMKNADINVDELHNVIQNNNLPNYMNSFNDSYKIMILYHFIDKYNTENIERKKCYSSFVPVEIQHYSEKNHNYIHRIFCDKIGLNITILSSNDISKINWVDTLIYRIITMKLLFKFTENIHIRILDTPFKKKINYFKTAQRVLGPREINSGFTTSGTNEIVIFRSEEILKVILHEMLHMFKIDSKINFNDSITNSVLEILHISDSSWVRPSEAIIELIANLYNSVFVTLEQNLTHNDFLKFIYTDGTHSIIQASRVLKYIGIQYNNNLIITPNADKIQRTSAISYYVIRASLYWCLGKIVKDLDLLKSYKKDYKINYDKYKNNIIKCLQNKNLMGKNGIIQTIPFHLIGNTLRMTVV